MSKWIFTIITFLAVTGFASVGTAQQAKGKTFDGKAEFDKHCGICHANGGNTINPAKTLSRKSLESHGIKTPKDIVMKMRKPGPGMTRFDEKIISDREAKAIADYVLKTFK
jgi:cytochrome c6